MYSRSEINYINVNLPPTTMTFRFSIDSTYPDDRIANNEFCSLGFQNVVFEYGTSSQWANVLTN